MRSMILAVARGQVLMPDMLPNMDWFNALNMPSWTPPGWLFPIMWLLVSKPTQVAACLTLASAMGTSISATCLPLVLWTLHLSLGDAWNEVFFNQQKVGEGAAVICAFYAVLLATAAAFARVSTHAGLLMLPTCAWVTVATSLNLRIWWINKESLGWYPTLMSLGDFLLRGMLNKA